MDTESHPKSIKLPDTVEVFGNLKNAKRFAIDIGKIPNYCISVNTRNDLEICAFTFFILNSDRVIESAVLWTVDCRRY
jgi:hypothetical protein